MSRLLILLFLIVIGLSCYYVINLLIKKRLTETFTAMPREASSIQDTNYFLTTSIMPGKVDIVNLKEHNPNHSNYSYLTSESANVERVDPKVVEHRPSKLDKVPLTCISPNDPISAKIKKLQPYMYDEPEIINLYDYPFYRDWRYPENPIDPRFAANPEKYCEANPQVYPCYRYFSKW